jgi:TolB-like protein/Flp pilus assembly protein TadD
VPLKDVADAILDGTPIEWRRLESSGEATDRELIEQLKTLAAVKFVALRAEPESCEIQASWGHLQVLEPIGRGVFGEVYRAWDPRLDREVALKLLPPDSAAAGFPPSSVIEEGRLLARVRHPNVVTIHGAERIAGRIGLWMEFVKGRTLEEVLREGKRFGAKEVTRIGLELCRAVSAVHGAGLLHRDIKAQNVMVTDDGRLVLMDFGTGRELEGASESNVAGTPLYLAPEVLSGGAATERSDVYSIGVLLHHLLTGSYPVQAHDLAELRRVHAARERTGLRSSRPDVPQRLARIVERACDPEPERRYGSADAFGEALAALEGLPASVRRAYGAAAAVALVAVGLIAWELAGRDPEPSRSTAAVGAGGVAVATRPAVAVLPFRNLGSQPGSDELVDGLTSEVIRSLARINGLHVRSRTSSFAFKNKPRDLRLIAGELGVDFIVEADVLRAGTGLRIDARLVRAADDVRLWSERFDNTVEDVFAIQDQISRGIAGTLRLRPRQPQRHYRTNFDAYELYLRARALVNKRGIDNALRAAPLFEQVIARTPAFAPAHAGLVDAYALMSWQLQASDGTPALGYDEALQRMRPAAERALELDADLPEAHAAMGHVYARELDWAKAARSFERAIELDASLTQIQTTYALIVLLPVGRIAEAVRLLDAALETDPVSLDVSRTLAFAQIVAGEYEEAIEHLRRVLSVDPDYPYVSLALARALTFSGRLEEALAVWSTRQAQGLGGEIWAAQSYVRSGRREDAERLLDTVDHPYRRAILFAALGDRERTLEALNGATDVLPQRTALLLVLPEMAFLRGDPRLADVRKKLKLP